MTTPPMFPASSFCTDDRCEHRASQTKCLEPAQTLALSKRLGPGSLGTATAWQLACSTALGLHELPRQWACGPKTGSQQEPPMDGQFKHAQQWHQLSLGWLFHAFEPISNPLVCFITHLIYPIFNLSHRLLTIYTQHMYSAYVSQAASVTIVYPCMSCQFCLYFIS